MSTLKMSLLLGLVAACFAGTAAADIVCPDSSYCTVSFTGTRNRIFIAPSGGETFVGRGITIKVYLRNCNGAPLVGVPREEVVIYNAALCLCPGGNVADAATDANGCTSFTGSIKGGGCVENLSIFADGLQICTIPVKTNSPDAIHYDGSCAVNGSDLAAFAAVLGIPARYDVCFDYIQNGVIDGSDLSYFASAFPDGPCP